jgi:thioredoxin 1
MKNGAKIAIVVLLAVAVAATFALRGGKRTEYVPPPDPPAAVATAEPAPAKPAAIAASEAVAAAVKPRLLELGSMRCQACLEMAKVLDALRASQGAKLQVDFIDVFEQPEAADRHKISLIPTQILFDATGKEIFRHTGYFAHNDILAKFRDLGVKL